MHTLDTHMFHYCALDAPPAAAALGDALGDDQVVTWKHKQTYQKPVNTHTRTQSAPPIPRT